MNILDWIDDTDSEVKAFSRITILIFAFILAVAVILITLISVPYAFPVFAVATIVGLALWVWWAIK